MKFTNLSSIPPEHTQDPDELTIPQHHYEPKFEIHSNRDRLYLEENVMPTLVPCLEKLLQLVEEEVRQEHESAESPAAAGQQQDEEDTNDGANNNTKKHQLPTRKLTQARRTPRRHDQYQVKSTQQKRSHQTSESQYAKRDPLNWLAMTLMRTNTKYSNELENHPYTKEIRKHTKLLHETLKNERSGA